MSEDLMKKPGIVWKYLGAMMMESKNGHMAASFTRVLGVLTFILWIVMIVTMMLGLSVPDTALYVVTSVLMTLVTGKSLKDLGKALKGHTSYGSWE